MSEKRTISVSDKDFVRIWQKSHSTKDVVSQTGMNYNAVLSRVRSYRKLGIPLKEMPRVRKARLNVDELAQLALELAPQSEE